MKSTQQLQAEEMAEAYAADASMFVEAALEPGSQLYRDHGPDRLLKAAQVYATLAAGA